ncbi:Trimethylguanosine synthase [Trichinella spiralis]|uniref:Trimethylguanosine synthase n=1 Tax=Trichinella spiralis TaxID=6334 RepID=A0ABR3L3Z6_TRISP
MYVCLWFQGPNLILDVKSRSGKLNALALNAWKCVRAKLEGRNSNSEIPLSIADQRIALDRESWYSVTPEKIAKHIAKRCKFASVVDAFCGAGSNAIHFSLAGLKVTAVDIDPEKIKLAKHNAAIYGVQDSIEFLCADFMKIYKNLSADFVFLSPPWGGPEYLNHDVYDDCLLLPRNSSILQIIHLAEPGTVIEVEKNYLNYRFKSLTVYFGMHDRSHRAAA